MIAFSQQYKIIRKVFTSFQSGQKVNNVKYTETDYNRGKLFLKPSKYENSTLSNFSIIVLNSMLREKPTSIIDFMKRLNLYNKKQRTELLQLKTELQSYRFLLEKDSSYLNQYSEPPYKLFKEKKISIFGVNDYYVNHPEEVTGRIMTKDIKDIEVLISHFNL